MSNLHTSSIHYIPLEDVKATQTLSLHLSEDEFDFGNNNPSLTESVESEEHRSPTKAPLTRLPNANSLSLVSLTRSSFSNSLYLAPHTRPPKVYAPNDSDVISYYEVDAATLSSNLDLVATEPSSNQHLENITLEQLPSPELWDLLGNFYYLLLKLALLSSPLVGPFVSGVVLVTAYQKQSSQGRVPDIYPNQYIYMSLASLEFLVYLFTYLKGVFNKTSEVVAHILLNPYEMSLVIFAGKLENFIKLNKVLEKLRIDKEIQTYQQLHYFVWQYIMLRTPITYTTVYVLIASWQKDYLFVNIFKLFSIQHLYIAAAFTYMLVSTVTYAYTLFKFLRAVYHGKHCMPSKEVLTNSINEACIELIAEDVSP